MHLTQSQLCGLSETAVFEDTLQDVSQKYQDLTLIIC